VNEPTSSVHQNVDGEKSARYGLVPYEPPKLALCEEPDMRIHQPDLDNVVFICSRERTPIKEGAERRNIPKATGFFVEMQHGHEPNVVWTYLVTARHVIHNREGITELFVRLRKKTGGYVDHQIDSKHWICSNQTDLAILPFSPQDEFIYSAIPIERLVGPGPDYKYNGPPWGSRDAGVQVGMGDDIISLGLFVQNQGQTGDLPIARFGHVSRMPSIIAKHKIAFLPNGIERKDIVAYLAEFLSWGGQSGSPVYWLYPEGVYMSSKSPQTRGVFRALLGLVVGHLPRLSKPVDKDDETEEIDEVRVKLNTGIAIIVPSEAIRELLMSPEIAEQRKAYLERIKNEHRDDIELD